MFGRNKYSYILIIYKFFSVGLFYTVYLYGWSYMLNNGNVCKNRKTSNYLYKHWHTNLVGSTIAIQIRLKNRHERFHLPCVNIMDLTMCLKRADRNVTGPMTNSIRLWTSIDLYGSLSINIHKLILIGATRPFINLVFLSTYPVYWTVLAYWIDNSFFSSY